MTIVLPAVLSFLFGLLSALVLKSIYTSYPTAYFVVDETNTAHVTEAKAKIVIYNGFSRIVDVAGLPDNPPAFRSIHSYAVPNQLTELPPLQVPIGFADEVIYLKIRPRMVWIRFPHPFRLAVHRLEAFPEEFS